MTYARPFRLRILDALTSVIQGITPANGYVNDLSTSTFRGRPLYGENDPLPMVSILEPPAPAEWSSLPHAAPTSKGDWILILQGFVEDDPLNPTDPAYVLLADVRQALAKERASSKNADEFDILGMGGKVMDLTMGMGVVRPPDDVSDKAYFWMPITLKIAEKSDTPYE